MCSLERSLLRLCREGLISTDEAARVATDPQVFAQMHAAEVAQSLTSRPGAPVR